MIIKDNIEYSVETRFTGSTDVQALNVTENGTYTAPEGTAYSPVVVNVAGTTSGNLKEVLSGQSNALVLPNDMTALIDYAFYRATINSVTFNNSIQSIGNYPFAESSISGNVTLPDSITSIGNGLFAGCSNLSGVTFPNNSELQIGGDLFPNTAITTITFPDHITELKWAICYNCNQLASVQLPSALQRITNNCFYNTAITEIDIPENVTYIGGGSFNDCSNLTTFICRAPEPPTIEADTLGGNTPADMAIYVLPESVDAYQNAPHWSDRAAYIQAI